MDRSAASGAARDAGGLGLEAVLFDFDGTLARMTLDFSLMRRRAEEALGRFGPVPQDPDLAVMERVEAFCRTLAPEQARAARAAALSAIEEVEVEAASRSALFPFARPLLRALAARGIAAAVVTRNCPRAVYAVFPDMDKWCACVLTRDDVPEVKPHPGHLLRALAIARCSARRSLMVGDHPMDIAAGKNACMFTAGVASGESSLERLAAEQPDFLAPDAGELMRQLRVSL